MDCSSRPAFLSHFSAVGTTNFLLTKKLVAVLQLSLSKAILPLPSLNNGFKYSAYCVSLIIFTQSAGIAWQRPKYNKKLTFNLNLPQKAS